ncbi:HAD family hydrolase [Segetibacter koreensis]|uniref:HAD family hydrolase n=1 Tax=Segetibacter koreensis TaxID=398037 RepID=UPI0003AAE1AB|nr:HAD family phosphatase [Segetibacter koreensis]
MKKIKNIIFDLGGIFIDIDFLQTEKAFKALGVANWNKFYTQSTASALFENLETGKITPEEFYENFRKESGVALSDEQIRDAWIAMLGTFPVQRLRWLQEIKKRYNIYLYSNTNLIHYIAFQKIFRDCTGEKNFDDYFIKAHYSHELGVRKPYPESFIKLLYIENLNANETLFIDDTANNIEGAKEAGLQTILLLPPKTVLDLDL